MAKSPEGFVHDSKPENLLKSPVFIQTGFAEDAECFEGLAHGLRDQGHNVYTLEHPKPLKKAEAKALFEKTKVQARAYYRGRYSEKELPSEYLDALLASVPLTLFEEAYSLRTRIEQFSDKGAPVTVFGHSQGAFSQVICAFLWHELFPNKDGAVSSLILMNPAGFTGQENIKESKFLEAAGKVRQSRFVKLKEMFGDVAHVFEIEIRSLISTFVSYFQTPADSKEQHRMGVALNGGLAHLFGKPIRAQREGIDLATTDILPFIQILTMNGLNVGVILDDKDSQFRAHVIKERLNNVPNVQLEIIENGVGHFTPLKKPELVLNKAEKILSKE